MGNAAARKPIGNFFIKRSLQIRLIIKIMFAVFLSTVISSFSLILVYFLKYDTVIVYQLNTMTQELSREHIIFLILPALVISSIVNLIVAFGIGLYASRKYAVPVFKLEQWANLLFQGKMTAMLRFREQDELKELTTKCNQVSVKLCETFGEIKKQLELVKSGTDKGLALASIEEIVNTIDLGSTPIEVNTTYYSITPNGAGEEN